MKLQINNFPGRDPAQKPLKIWAVWTVLSGLSKKKRSKTAQDLNGFERCIQKKNAQKPRKIWEVFERFFR